MPLHFKGLITGGPSLNVCYARLSHFSSCDLDLDPMTLTYKLDLDISKTYLHTKKRSFHVKAEKVRAQTERQTDVT